MVNSMGFSRTNTRTRFPACGNTYAALVIAMNEGGHDCIQNLVQVLASVFRQEPQNEISVLLQQCVFSPVTTVSLLITEMLRAVQFNDHTVLGAEEVDLHLAGTVERYGDFHVQAKATRRCWEGLQSAKKKRLAGAPGAGFPGSVFGRSSGSVHEQIRQRDIHAVADEAANAGGVVPFPVRING